MAECARVPSRLTDAAIKAGEAVERRYLRDGGSSDDFRTDMSYIVEAVLDTLVGVAEAPTPRLRRRTWVRDVVSTPSYIGPERRTRP